MEQYNVNYAESAAALNFLVYVGSNINLSDETREQAEAILRTLIDEVFEITP